jgi:hypothetical protein
LALISQRKRNYVMSALKDTSYKEEVVKEYFRLLINTMHQDAFVDKDGDILTTAALDSMRPSLDYSDPQDVHLICSFGRRTLLSKIKLPLSNFSEYLKGLEGELRNLRVILRCDKTLAFCSDYIDGTFPSYGLNSPEFYSSLYKDVEVMLERIKKEGVEFSIEPVPPAFDAKDVLEEMAPGRRGPSVAPPPLPSWRDRAVQSKDNGHTVGGGGGGGGSGGRGLG